MKLLSMLLSSKKANQAIISDFDVLEIPAYVRYNIKINGANQYSPIMLMIHGWEFKK